MKPEINICLDSGWGKPSQVQDQTDSKEKNW